MAAWLLLALGCGASPPPSSERPRLVSGAARGAALPIPQYVLRTSVSLLQPPRDDRVLTQDGLRIALTPAGYAISHAPGAATGFEIPPFLGGGYLFATYSKHLLRAPSFLGPLEPVVELRDTSSRVQFGPGFVWLDGVAVELPSGRVLDRPPVRDLEGIAALADGRVVAALRGRRAQMSTDGGRSWSPIAIDDGHVPEVRAGDDSLWVSVGADRWLKLERDGALAPAAPPPQVRAGRSALETAVEGGIAIDERHAAAVLDDGAVVEVDLATGSSQALGRIVSASRCELLRTPSDVLAVCDAERRPTVHAGVLSRPRIDRVLRGARRFFAGADGTLVAAGGCGAEQHPAMACVRRPDGRWSEVDLRSAFPNLGSSNVALRWIPKHGGGVDAALVAPICTGWPECGPIVDGSTREPKRLNVPREVFRLEAAGVVDRRWIATPDGTLHAYDGASVYDITPRGVVVVHAIPARECAIAGARALCVDAADRWRQSLDFGLSWQLVAGPPTPEAASSARCSEVGCAFRNWLRLTWRNERPRAAQHDRRVDVDQAALGKAPPAAPPPPAPELACVPTGPAEPKPLLAPLAEDETRSLTVWFRVGASTRGSVENPFDLERWLEGNVHLDRAWLRIAYTQPFDLSVRLRTTRALVSEWAAANTWSHGSEWFFPKPDGKAVPILAPGGIDGLAIHSDSATLWVPGSGTVRALLGPSLHEELVSVARTSDGRLVALAESRYSERDYREWHLGRYPAPREILPAELPEQLAASLAFDASDRIGLITAPLRAPIEHDPAKFVRRDASPVVLAPWSTLRPAGGDECMRNRSGVRGVLRTRGWLRLRLGEQLALETEELLLVRWSGERVCLEAAEVYPAGAADPSTGAPFVLVSFTPPVGARKLHIAGSVPESEPLHCEIRSMDP